jgi:hypothetical protein
VRTIATPNDDDLLMVCSPRGPTFFNSTAAGLVLSSVALAKEDEAGAGVNDPGYRRNDIAAPTTNARSGAAYRAGRSGAAYRAGRNAKAFRSGER